MLRAYVAEFLGTFTLLFGVVGAIAGGMDQIGVILLNGIIIAVMIAALGPASGAHFNPAVTLGMLLTNRISLAHALAYWAAQLLGAVVAVGLLLVLLGQERLARVNYGTPRLAEGISLLAGAGLELVLTFLLVFVIVTTALHLKNPMAASYIGLAVALGVMAGTNLTGAAMNPARALGSAVWGGDFEAHWAYWVGPLAGGVLATLVADWMYAKREVLHGSQS